MRIKNIPHRREAVTAINVFDKENGIGTSQKAKYEKPLWYFILAVLPSQDAKPVTIDDIRAKLARHNIIVTYAAIRSSLLVMINKEASIHPHRRNCGVGCFEAVNLLGDIVVDFCAYPSSDKHGRGAWSDGYALGKSFAQVHYYKKACAISLKP